MRLGRQVVAGLVMAGFGLALGLVMLEVMVRSLHLVPTRFWEPDPLLGTRLIANHEGWWTQEEHEFNVYSHINADGRRDVERTVRKPTGVFRVLLLGDSFIEALQVPLQETFGRQLEARLDKAAQPVEVVMMGVSGYGTAGEFLYYRELGRRFEADLVLLAFYPGNDVRNNSPVLEPVLRPVYDANGALQRIVAKQKKVERGWLGSSQAYRYFRKLLLTRQPRLAAWLVRLGMLRADAQRGEPTRAGVPVDYWVYSSDLSADWQDAWMRTVALLRSFVDAVRADGAELALIVVPGRDQVDRGSWEAVLEANPAMSALSWDLTGLERKLIEWCRRESVPCLSLLPSFEVHAEDGSTLHFHYDGHWTAAGHALAADTTAAFLRDRSLVSKDRRVRQ
jgi:hypothetical protein